MRDVDALFSACRASIANRDWTDPGSTFNGRSDCSERSAMIAPMLQDLASSQAALVVLLLIVGIYPVGRLAQWGLWRVIRWVSCRVWGKDAARRVDMAIHPDPKWKQREIEIPDR